MLCIHNYIVTCLFASHIRITYTLYYIGICNTKPKDRFGDSRFNNHQLRWAYIVVKQHAVRVKHIATGLEFLALVPFTSMLKRTLHVVDEEVEVVQQGSGSGGVAFELDGSVTVRAERETLIGEPVTLNIGRYSV